MHKNIKPYFVEDLTAWLKAAYFSLAINSRGNREFWRGVLATLATLALALEINPDEIFSADDAQLLRSNK